MVAHFLHRGASKQGIARMPARTASPPLVSWQNARCHSGFKLLYALPCNWPIRTCHATVFDFWSFVNAVQRTI